MSHGATSMPANALVSIAPPLQEGLNDAKWWKSSISPDGRPMRRGPRYVSMTVRMASGRCGSLAHPHPIKPASDVSIFTTTRGMPTGAVRNVLTFVTRGDDAPAAHGADAFGTLTSCFTVDPLHT